MKKFFLALVLTIQSSFTLASIPDGYDYKKHYEMEAESFNRYQPLFDAHRTVFAEINIEEILGKKFVSFSSQGNSIEIAKNGNWKYITNRKTYSGRLSTLISPNIDENSKFLIFHDTKIHQGQDFFTPTLIKTDKAILDRAFGRLIDIEREMEILKQVRNANLEEFKNLNLSEIKQELEFEETEINLDIDSGTVYVIYLGDEHFYSIN